MAAVHLGWRPAWDFIFGCGQGRPNPVAMVRRPSSSTSMRASRSSRVMAAADRPTVYPSRRRCVIVRTTGLFMHFLSVHLDLKRLRISVWLSFHQRDNDKESPTLLLGPRDLAVQHQKTKRHWVSRGSPPCNTTKQTALTQQNNPNTTRVKRAPKTISLGKEKPQITRKFMEAEEENEELHTPTHPFTHPHQTRQMEHWCTRDLIMHVTFHDGILCVHACDLR